MARSPQGSRSSTAWEPPKPEARSRIVRLGRPANDNGLRTQMVLRVLGIVASAAIVVYGLLWLGVI